MALYDTVRALNVSIAARQKHEAETPARVAKWREDLGELYDTVEEGLSSIPPDMLSFRREDRTDKQADLGDFSAIDLLLIVKGEVVLKFEAKASSGEGHFGVVDIVRPGGKGAGRLLRIASGWTIRYAKDRGALSSVNVYQLSSENLEPIVDAILRF